MSDLDSYGIRGILSDFSFFLENESFFRKWGGELGKGVMRKSGVFFGRSINLLGVLDGRFWHGEEVF